MGKNIYYHFFDRELRQSVKATLSDEDISNIIFVSLLMTDGIFYLPISNLYESLLEFPLSSKYLVKLDGMGLVHLASSHSSVENFILSRQNLYNHDKERYPMYFNNEGHPWTSNLITLENSTTKILRDKLSDNQITIKELDHSKNSLIDGSVKNIVENEKYKAITYSLFKDSISSISDSKLERSVISNELRRQISIFYTQRYLEVADGTLVTGIKSINQYDMLAKDLFTTNYRIYTQVLKIIGVDISSPSFFDLILSLRQERHLFEGINSMLNNLMQSLLSLFKENKYLLYEYSKYLYSDKTYPEIKDISTLYENLVIYLSDICKRHRDLEMEMKKMDADKKSLVILAVTSIEMKALINTVKKYCPSNLVVEKIVDNLVYREIVGCKFPVYIVQSEMGVSGTGSIINTLHKIFILLNPERIIMVGIGFGIDSEKQKIGDIMVSRQVWNYEPSKVTASVNISRGDKVTASSFLLQLFHSTELEHDINVHFGLLASGEKLINSKEFLSELKSSEEEIVGGDMEAAGLVSVCVEKKSEWIVIKAICDWGYDKHDADQKLAAQNACEFLMKGLTKII